MPLHWMAWQITLDEYGLVMSEERFYSLGGVPTREIIKMLGEEATAQCYGYHIYIKGNKEDYSLEQLFDLYVHEITHSLQFKDLGEDLKQYGDEYFRAYYKAGEDYALNIYEIEADKRASLWYERLVQEYQKSN